MHQKFRSPTTSSSRPGGLESILSPHLRGSLLCCSNWPLLYSCMLFPWTSELVIPPRRWGLCVDRESSEISAWSGRMGKQGKVPPPAGAVSGSKLVRKLMNSKHIRRQFIRTSNTTYHMGNYHPWVAVGMQIFDIRYRTINKSNRHHLSFQHSAKGLLCWAPLGDMIYDIKRYFYCSLECRRGFTCMN